MRNDKYERVGIIWTGVRTTPLLMSIDRQYYTRGSLGLSAMALVTGDSQLRNLVGPLKALLNQPGGVDDTGRPERLVIEHEHEVARVWMEGALRAQDAEIKVLRGQGGMSVRHEERAAYIDRELIGASHFLDGLRRNGLHTGQQPFKVDGEHLMSDADRAVVVAKRRNLKSDSYRVDALRYYRMPARPHNLRTDDIRCVGPIIAALDGYIPEYAMLPVLAIRDGGIRARLEAVGTSMLGVHKGGGFETPMIFVNNKGGGAEPDKPYEPAPDSWARHLVFIDGDRRLWDRKGRGLAEWKEISRRATMGDKEAIAELRAERLYITPTGRPLTYENLTGTFVRPRLRAAGVKATLHMMRHEYVHNRLREIERMPITIEEKRLRRKRLARHMGWSTGVKMFRIYDAFEEQQRLLREQAEYGRRRAEGLAAAQALAADPDAPVSSAPWIDRPSPERNRFLGARRPSSVTVIDFAKAA